MKTSKNLDLHEKKYKKHIFKNVYTCCLKQNFISEK